MWEDQQHYNSLIQYAPYMTRNDELKAKKFFQGLMPLLRRYVVVVDIWGYLQVVQKALASKREIEDLKAPSKKVEVGPANLGKSVGKQPVVGMMTKN